MQTDLQQKRPESNPGEKDTTKDIGSEETRELPRVELFRGGDIPNQLQSQTYLTEQDGFSVSHIWPYTQAADYNNFIVNVFTAYFPCELRGVTYIYGTAGSVGGAGFNLVRKGLTTNGTITNSVASLTATANVVYYIELTGLNPVYRYFKKGDALYIEQFNAFTLLRDLCITFHFKYSGRGESRA